MILFCFFYFALSLNIHIILVYCGILNSLRSNYSQYSRSSMLEPSEHGQVAALQVLDW